MIWRVSIIIMALAVSAVAASKYHRGPVRVAMTTVTAPSGDTSLKLYWKFDDASGTTCADSSGNGKTGTAVSATITNSTAPVSFSNPYARDFTNTTGRKVFTTQFTLSGAGTLALWAKPETSQPDGGGIPTLASGNGLEFCFAPGSVMFYKPGGAFATMSPPLGVWHHYALASDATNMILYIDGTNRETVAYSFSLNGSFMVGSYNGSYPLSGIIDEVRVYNRALSSNEVYNLSQGQESP